jgi:hypothetical protein
VRGGTAVAGPAGLRRQVVPPWLLTADVALRQLEQQRGRRLGDRRQVRHRDEAIPVSRRAADDPVQPLVCLPLVLLEMAHRVKDDRPAIAAIGVHP